MPQKLDLTGQRFGRLVAIEQGEHYRLEIQWICQCDCGRKLLTRGYSLRIGKTKSCGCRLEEIKQSSHALGGKQTAEYRAWYAMRQRCNSPNHIGYKHYGERGISVCDRWSDFGNFLEDMGPKPEQTLSVERLNNSKGYSPDNCKWGTRIEQANNKRNNTVIEFNGARRTISEWSAITGIKKSTLRQRLKRGWQVPKLLFNIQE